MKFFRRWPLPRLRNADGDRYQLWPIKFGLVPKFGEQRLYAIDQHGWHVGYERVPPELTSRTCVSGVRSVFGQTLHMGFFQIQLGGLRSGIKPVGVVWDR